MTVTHSIHIEAPPAVVWAVTEDVERWPEWTPTVTAVRRLDAGPFGLGSVARLKQPAQPEADWTVTAFTPEEQFTWETRRPGLHIVGTHQMRQEGNGTLNTLRVEASDALAVVLWPLLRLAIGHALRQENHGLKTRCEALAAARSS